MPRTKRSRPPPPPPPPAHPTFPTLPPFVYSLEPQGDLILAIGSAPFTRILVSSANLRASSGVFARTFNSYISHGRRLNPIQPFEISLPDNDPLCMEILLAGMHSSHNEPYIRCPRSARAILSTFPLAEKYQCVSLIKAIGLEFLDRGVEVRGHSSMAERLILLYLAQHGEAFNSITANAVSHCAEPFTFLYERPEDLYDLPGNIVAFLEDQREKGWELLRDGLRDLVGRVCFPCEEQGMEYADDVCWRFEQAVLEVTTSNMGPLGMGRVSLSHACEQLLGMDDGEWKSEELVCVGLDRTRHSHLPRMDMVRALIRMVMESCGGFCLVCVKDNIWQPGNMRACSFKHEKDKHLHEA